MMFDKIFQIFCGEKIPKDFYCPITGKIIRDPVITADGYTYERKAIEEWLKKSEISPITGLILPHRDLIPNYALKGVIEKHLEQKKLEEEDFCCSITRGIICDPVTTADGYTYEREAIEEWFKNSNSNRSQWTGLTLPHRDLIPNRALKGVITEYQGKLYDLFIKKGPLVFGFCEYKKIFDILSEDISKTQKKFAFAFRASLISERILILFVACHNASREVQLDKLITYFDDCSNQVFVSSKKFDELQEEKIVMQFISESKLPDRCYSKRSPHEERTAVENTLLYLAEKLQSQHLFPFYRRGISAREFMGNLMMGEECPFVTPGNYAQKYPCRAEFFKKFEQKSSAETTQDQGIQDMDAMDLARVLPYYSIKPLQLS